VVVRPRPGDAIFDRMCGRVCLSSDVREIKLVFSIPAHRATPNFAPGWNAAPTDPFAGPNRGFEVHPQPVADPIEEVKHWPQIGAGRSCQERRGGSAVAIAVAVPLDEPEARHRIGADPQGPTRHAAFLGQLVKRRRTAGQPLEQPDRAGDKQVLGRHEA